MATFVRPAPAAYLPAVETAFHVVAAGACWLASLVAAVRASGALVQAGPLPRSAEAAWAFATSPGLETRIVGWAGGTVGLAVAGALAACAAEGTWYVWRRLTR